ncbi:DUF1501 domain-containing protein [Bremerella sp. P1]|uniref:DUF1501 domain-containing protein n=1 Tax=Bremerella sp. P1 TaxID=3026424 RepID=UPI0023678462|nr:DUF1501 domain-containing protein [Bremerella sp. P1]WDI40529.1 DUF1501 domain-containing protein [Bremerella sp. P1]
MTAEFGMRANRRAFLRNTGVGLGSIAACTLAPEFLSASSSDVSGKLPGLPHHEPKAKRVIYLFQSGAPSQFESFDYKPGLNKLAKTELPESVRMGQRLTGMTAGQQSFPIAPSLFKFSQHGEAGTWVSDRLPYIADQADKLCVIRSMHTEAINHDPAITFFQTGSQLPGRPSMGSWVAYGLGTANENLPSYIVLVSRGTGRAAGQPLYDRLWGSGVLPGKHQGVKLRGGNDPILYLTDPAGCPPQVRRRMLDDIGKLNQATAQRTLDPEVTTRIEQYELAFRMQTAVPDLVDLSQEPEHVLKRYGPEVTKPGTYARNCLLARRLAERDVRFIQLFHMGWDQHDNLPDHMTKQCYDTDQPTAALLQDLEERGLLEDTLVVWGGEFGRTVYCQGTLTETNYGRDHHPRSFSIFMAGGGVKPGLTYGATDEFGYNITENPVHVNDLHATILHLLGIDHRRLTIPFQGLALKLSGVEDRHPVTEIFA